MSFKPKDLTYKITGFDTLGNVIVTFNCDGSSQICGSCPTDTADNAKAYLDQYVKDYIAGIQSAAVLPDAAIPNDVKALVGKTQTPAAEV